MMDDMNLETIISVACLASNKGELKEGVLADLQQMYDDVEDEYKDAKSFHLIEKYFGSSGMTGLAMIKLLNLLGINTGRMFSYYIRRACKDGDNVVKH